MTPAIYTAAIERITRRRRAVHDDRPALEAWDREGTLEWLDLRRRATQWRDEDPENDSWQDVAQSANLPSTVSPIYHPFRRGRYGMRHLHSYNRAPYGHVATPLSWQIQGYLSVMARQPQRWEWDYPVEYRVEDPILGQKM